MRTLTAIIIVFFCFSGFSPAQGRRGRQRPEKLPTISEKVAGMQKHEGFLTFYWDKRAEKLWIEIPAFGEDLLHTMATASGVAGRDRGGWGGQRVVRFERNGSKVFMVRRGFSYRALSEDPLERRSVEEAYTDPIIAGFVVAAEEQGRVLVDATDFFMREGARGSVDRKRSAFHWPRTRAFPRNTEIEVILTTSGGSSASRGGGGQRPGGARSRFGRGRGGSGGASTIRLHHSFVQLPGPGYRPRRHDPRAGVSGTSFTDYASPLQEPIRKRWITRHRLQKKDPGAAVSEALEPIVYYVDPGAPEPIRSALVEGASWWNEAFEAIGFKDAFQVRVLPADADPMDLRYNLILWTHRPERGWSMGTSVRDPRTGEIIAGRVFLGSQRVRQDFLIGSGLVAPYGDDPTAISRITEMVLARTRQLAAHEVGHTLGFGHNFAASTRGRASVMDYPHPRVKLAADGSFDLSDAYDVGIGEWDKVFVAYAYSEFPAGADEREGLDGILDRAHRSGLFFLGTVGSGSASPLTHQWDDGPDALAEFGRVMQVRRAALERLSEKNIPAGAPLARLQEVLVPVYLFHRYQTEAVSKSLGGVDYRFAARGDGQVPWKLVPPDVQRRALSLLLTTLDPAELAIPRHLLALLGPRSGFGGEVFPSRTRPTFDPLAAAETMADHTVRLVTNRERAARLVVHHALDAGMPSLAEVLGTLVDGTWRRTRKLRGYEAEIARTVDGVVLRHLMQLAADTRAQAQVRAAASQQLVALADWAGRHIVEISRGDTPHVAARAHLDYARRQIRHFLEEPQGHQQSASQEIPAGAPIGMGTVPLPGLEPRAEPCGWDRR